jgi:glycosyltransferase involved in cell wall biosynthesis
MNIDTEPTTASKGANSQQRPRYSFVVPVFRDAGLARDFCQQFKAAFSCFLQTEELNRFVEVLFVCDGGARDDFSTVDLLRADYPFVRCFELSRNFGQHVAICCGYAHARGDIVGMLNVDQQDPPEELITLIRYAEANDCDIVHGTSDSRYASLGNRITSSLFNLLLNKLTGYNLPLNTCTARVLKRPVVDVFNGLAERQRYIPGLESWMGFRHAYVPIRTQMRSVGRSSYNFRRRLSLALEAVISFSDIPLRVGVVLGALFALGGLVMGVALIVQKIWFLNLAPGYTSTVVLLVFFGGMQLLFAGLMSLYIGRILTEVQRRPLYIVRRSSDYREA